MRRLTSTLLLASLAWAGCAEMQVRDRLARARGVPIVAVDDVSFDGECLNGRILISSNDAGYVVVDRRLAAHAIVVVDGVFDCDGGSTVDSIAADSVIKSPRPADLQVIEPGYWYGSDFRLLVYAEEKATRPTPACIQALLAVNFEATAPGADRPQLIVRAQLTRSDAGADAGTDRPDAAEP